MLLHLIPETCLTHNESLVKLRSGHQHAPKMTNKTQIYFIYFMEIKKEGTE